MVNCFTTEQNGSEGHQWAVLDFKCYCTVTQHSEAVSVHVPADEFQSFQEWSGRSGAAWERAGVYSNHSWTQPLKLRLHCSTSFCPHISHSQLFNRRWSRAVWGPQATSSPSTLTPLPWLIFQTTPRGRGRTPVTTPDLLCSAPSLKCVSRIRVCELNEAGELFPSGPMIVAKYTWELKSTARQLQLNNSCSRITVNICSSWSALN